MRMFKVMGQKIDSNLFANASMDVHFQESLH